jgi:hypothetical protein
VTKDRGCEGGLGINSSEARHGRYRLRRGRTRPKAQGFDHGSVDLVQQPIVNMHHAIDVSRRLVRKLDDA